jgi:hypothetical protein
METWIKCTYIILSETWFLKEKGNLKMLLFFIKTAIYFIADH